MRIGTKDFIETDEDEEHFTDPQNGAKFGSRRFATFAGTRVWSRVCLPRPTHRPMGSPCCKRPGRR